MCFCCGINVKACSLFPSAFYYPPFFLELRSIYASCFTLNLFRCENFTQLMAYAFLHFDNVNISFFFFWLFRFFALLVPSSYTLTVFIHRRHLFGWLLLFFFISDADSSFASTPLYYFFFAVGLCCSSRHFE